MTATSRPNPSNHNNHFAGTESPGSSSKARAALAGRLPSVR
jgi:hypothetical protein